jgi:carboxypeptidase C (cathepsin A)
MSTILPQLSPNALIGNPTSLNPLAHSTYNLSAAAAGTMAQQKTARDKSDSVTISRQALEKAAEAEGPNGDKKETQTKEAPNKAKL